MVLTGIGPVLAFADLEVRCTRIILSALVCEVQRDLRAEECSDCHAQERGEGFENEFAHDQAIR